MSHPNCTPVHVCQQPSGRVCVEQGCEQQAGTWWGPLWCPEHDKVRIDRVSAGFALVAAAFAPEPDDSETRAAVARVAATVAEMIDAAIAEPDGSEEDR